MTEQGNWPHVENGTARGERAVESLLRLSGPREAVPSDRLQRLKAAAHADWTKHIAARRRRRGVAWSVGAFAAAAALVLLVGLTTWVSPGTGVVPAYATVESLSGAAPLATSANDGNVVSMRVGDRVVEGRKMFTTGAGTAALRLAGGALLRMDRDTALRFAAPDALVLAKGAAYVDAGGGPPIEVRTRLGVVRDVGTQFEVRLAPAALRVRVREGAVRVRGDRQQYDVRAGDEITLDPSGAATRRAVAADDPEWRWALGVAALFELEGRSLREFLDWIAAENRWQLRFASAAVEDRARTTTLHGSIDGLTAEQALAAVLPTSGLRHQLERGVLSIQPGASAKD